jgi:hypothetical protein
MLGCLRPCTRLPDDRRSGRTKQHHFALPLPDFRPLHDLWCLRLHDPHAGHRSGHDPLDALDGDAAVDDPILDHCIVRDVLRHLDERHITGRGGDVGAHVWS